METTNLLNAVRTNHLGLCNVKSKAKMLFVSTLRLWKHRTNLDEINFWNDFDDCPIMTWSSWGSWADVYNVYIRRITLDENGDMVSVEFQMYDNRTDTMSADEFYENDVDYDKLSEFILEKLSVLD